MNLWNDLEWKWPLESKSEPEIEIKHPHHKDMTNLVNYTTNVTIPSHTLSMSVKDSILLQ